MIFNRFIKINDIEQDSVVLFGARQTGKTTLLKSLFPKSIMYDLLESDEYERLSRRPALLREELLMKEKGSLVIIDEIQRIPELLNEVHWLIVNHQIRFILSGSSARKLKHAGINTLGGRALINKLFPLVSAEIPDFDLIKAVNNGMIPCHYLAGNAWKRLQSYVGIYLAEEIKAEATVRQVSAFNRFLEMAALTNGEMVNYTNIASDCGVSSNTVKEYFNILEDTLIGYYVPAYTKTLKRKVVQSPKFYLFDVGVANFLRNWKNLQPGSIDFGHAFEHLIIQEIIAYLSYSDNASKLSYWRTSTGIEVDAVLGQAEVAIEIKSTSEVKPQNIKNLRVFKEEHPSARTIIVSLDKNPRLLGNVEVFPALYFLELLWSGKII